MGIREEQTVPESVDMTIRGNFESLKSILNREQLWLRLKLLGCGIITSTGLVTLGYSLGSVQHGQDPLNAYGCAVGGALLSAVGAQKGAKNKAALSELQETRQRDELYARINSLGNYYINIASISYTYLSLQRMFAKITDTLPDETTKLTSTAILDKMVCDTDAFIHTIRICVRDFSELSFDELGGQQQKEQVNIFIRRMADMWATYQNLYNENYKQFREYFTPPSQD